MGSTNRTQSVWFPEMGDADDVASQVLTVFLGLAFVALVCVLLTFTVVAGALREMNDWARRKALAEHELAEVGGLPPLEDYDDYMDEDSVDGQHTDPPLIRCTAL